jgi:hypothetical protein
MQEAGRVVYQVLASTDTRKVKRKVDAQLEVR